MDIKNKVLDTSDESIQDPQNQEKKRFTPFLHQMPSLKVNKSKLLSKILQGQIPSSATHKSGYNKYQNGGHEATDLRSSYPTAQIFHRPRKSDFGIPQKCHGFKEENEFKMKKETIIETSNDKVLQDLYKSPVFTKHSPSQADIHLPILRKSSCTFFPTENQHGNDVHPETKRQESNEMGSLQLNGVYFSDSRDRFSVYQKRFVSLKAQAEDHGQGQSQFEPKRSQFIPKLKQKHDTISPKIPTKLPSHQDTENIAESLGQYLHINGPLHENHKPICQNYVPVAEEKKEVYRVYEFPAKLKSVKSHKRVASLGQSSAFKTTSSDKEGRTTIEKELGKSSFGDKTSKGSLQEQSKASLETINQAKEKIPENAQTVKKNTAEFKKRMVIHLENQNVNQINEDIKNIFIPVASPLSCKLNPGDEKFNPEKLKNREGKSLGVPSSSKAVRMEREQKKNIEEEKDKSLQELIEMMKGQVQGGEDLSFEEGTLESKVLDDKNMRSSYKNAEGQKVNTLDKKVVIGAKKPRQNYQIKTDRISHKLY